MRLRSNLAIHLIQLIAWSSSDPNNHSYQTSIKPKESIRNGRIARSQWAMHRLKVLETRAGPSVRMRVGLQPYDSRNPLDNVLKDFEFFIQHLHLTISCTTQTKTGVQHWLEREKGINRDGLNGLYMFKNATFTCSDHLSLCLEQDNNFYEGFLDPDDFKVNGSVRRQVKKIWRKEGQINFFEWHCKERFERL